MKVFFSVDMEGVAGVVDWDHALRDKQDYQMGRELMIGEANAAIEGAVAAGAKEIFVADSHGAMFNMPPEKFHPAARIIQGRNKPLSMMEGISKDFDAVCFVGYHAMAGTSKATLAHTYTGAIMQARLNGKPVGETALNGGLAAYFGVPVVFVSGDTALCREAKHFFPGAVTVAVKEGLGFRVANAMHPVKAREAIAAGVERALKAPRPAKNNLPKPPYRLEVDLREMWIADICQMIPGVVRRAGATVEFRHEDYLTVYGAFLTIMRLT